MKRATLYLAYVLIAAAACDGTQPPVPGTLTASLVTPNIDDGAVLVRVTGPGLANVRPVGTAYLLFWRLNAPDQATVIVVGNVTGGPIFTIEGATAGNRATDYLAGVVEVADRDDALRGDPAGYEIALAGPSGE